MNKLTKYLFSMIAIASLFSCDGGQSEFSFDFGRSSSISSQSSNESKKSSSSVFVTSIDESTMVHVDTISFDEEELSLQKGETYQFVITILPANATIQSYWFEVDNEDNISITEDGLLTALKEDSNSTVAVHSHDSYVTAFCSVRVRAKGELPPM